MALEYNLPVKTDLWNVWITCFLWEENTMVKRNCFSPYWLKCLPYYFQSQYLASMNQKGHQRKQTIISSFSLLRNSHQNHPLWTSSLNRQDFTLLGGLCCYVLRHCLGSVTWEKRSDPWVLWLLLLLSTGKGSSLTPVWDLKCNLTRTNQKEKDKGGITICWMGMTLSLAEWRP